MNKFIPGFVVIALLVGAFYLDRHSQVEEEDDFGRPLSLVFDAPSYPNGKIKKTKAFKSVYRYNNLDSLGFFPLVDANLMHILRQQELYLKKNKNQKHRIGKLSFSNKDLLKVINTLRAYQFTFPVGLSNQFDFYQLKGQDNRGNVKFSAYYTPVIKASRTKSAAFPLGIYKRPEDREEMPSRQAIEDGTLDDGNYAIAYIADYQELRKLALEGSGILQFTDGSAKHVVYHSSNGIHQVASRVVDTTAHKEKTKAIQVAEEEILVSEEANDSLEINEVVEIETVDNEVVSDETTDETNIEEEIEKPEELALENGHYPFFMEVKKKKVSATGIPLVPWYSIAVDQNYVPLGSCLLAATPVIDKNERFKRHALQYVLAQDTGGKIKGAGRVDWFVGDGEKAAKIAQAIHHYGQLWLILPKKKRSEGLSQATNKKTNNMKS
jgi:membrane-bound lytic murein transglycosylase A